MLFWFFPSWVGNQSILLVLIVLSGRRHFTFANWFNRSRVFDATCCLSQSQLGAFVILLDELHLLWAIRLLPLRQALSILLRLIAAKRWDERILIPLLAHLLLRLRLIAVVKRALFWKRMTLIQGALPLYVMLRQGIRLTRSLFLIPTWPRLTRLLSDDLAPLSARLDAHRRASWFVLVGAGATFKVLSVSLIAFSLVHDRIDDTIIWECLRLTYGSPILSLTCLRFDRTWIHMLQWHFRRFNFASRCRGLYWCHATWYFFWPSFVQVLLFWSLFLNLTAVNLLRVINVRGCLIYIHFIDC